MQVRELAAHPTKGSVFVDRYLVEKTLGAGGFSTVYLATDTVLERQVALKVLTPQLDDKESFETVRERFFQEAQILAQLQSPHTVRLYDYDDHPGQLLYMALEYVDGATLKEHLESAGRFEPRRALDVTEQILQGLREVHGLDVLHRDLKPQNVMLFEHLDDADRVKLLDFGIAKSLTAHGKDLTAEGALVGTPRYLSPEQLLGERIGPPSDVYAVGLLLFEMLVGESPHDTHDFVEIHGRMRTLPQKLDQLSLDPELQGNRIRDSRQPVTAHA